MLDFINIPALITNYGYLGIFLVVFLESGIFFALPGDSLLFTVGLLAAGGLLNIYIAIAVIFVSTFLGSIIGYEIGVNLTRFKKYYLLRSFLKDENLNKAHKFYEKYGQYAMIICRFVPVVRTFSPIGAGVAKMNYFSFLKYNLLGSIIWAIVVPFVGYFLGNIFPQIQDYMSIVIIIVVMLSVLPIFYEVIKNRKEY